MSNAINDYLLREGARYSTDINQKMMAASTPWITLYPQETWPEERGSTQNTFQFDRAQLVADQEVDWVNVGQNINADEGGSCIPPADEVIYTETSRTFNLQQKAIWGPRICVNDLRDTFIREKQMNACSRALADQARETWIHRKRSEYKRLSSNKIVLDDNFDLLGQGFGHLGFPAPGSNAGILDNSTLDYVYEYLNHQNAQDGALGMSDGLAIYGLVVSPRQSRRLARESWDLRQDFRFSSQNEKFLGPMGTKYSFNGFTHLADDKVDRWESYTTAASGADGTQYVSTVTAGVLTLSAAVVTPVITAGSEIIVGGNTYIVTSKITSTTFNVINDDLTAATGISSGTHYFHLWAKIPQFVKATVGGQTKNIPNPAWLNATWEDSYVFHQRMCVSLVPKPLTSVSGAKFDAVNYAGEFSWKNYLTEDKNPDGNIGRFRGVLMNGTRPDNPEFGVVIRHKACPKAGTRITDCSTIGAP